MRHADQVCMFIRRVLQALRANNYSDIRADGFCVFIFVIVHTPLAALFCFTLVFFVSSFFFFSGKPLPLPTVPPLTLRLLACRQSFPATAIAFAQSIHYRGTASNVYCKTYRKAIHWEWGVCGGQRRMSQRSGVSRT